MTTATRQAEINNPPKRIVYGYTGAMVNTREVHERPYGFHTPGRVAATWKQIDAAVAGMTSDGMREHDVYVFAEWRVVTLPNQWGNVAVYVTYSDNEPFAHAYCDIHGV